MTSRAELAVELAPVSPPCFPTRGQWLQYVASAAEASKRDHSPGPIVIEAGNVRFNYATFNVCEDCCAKHSHEMSRQGLCQPGYLASLGRLAEMARQVAPTNYQRVSA